MNPIKWRSVVALVGILMTAGLSGGLVVMSAGIASAEPSSLGKIVNDDPWNRSPHVLDGRVLSIVQVGDQIVLGGAFTQAKNDQRNDPSGTIVARSNLMAFDAQTGVISQTFAPTVDGTVNVVLPAGDGTVYVGGSFTTISGQPVKNLARVRVSDGSLVASFDGGSPAGQVKDLRLSGGRLWVAGAFTHIAGKKQAALATLNPQTGKFDAFERQVIAGTHRGKGYTTVSKIDVNPSATRLVAIGNFHTVDAITNHQIVMIDTSGATAQVSGFQTSFYTTLCSASFDSYMRDLDFSPDGSFFVVSTTGAYGGAGAACDSTARFETDSVGTNVQPSWINNTGGDTTYAVEITDSVVYTGGHARWQNNPFAGDRAGQGAVSRPGIAALDPSNGLPYSWNPTRDRGVGVFDLLATSQGLWVGSDTDRIGNSEYHGRIALMPSDGGKDIAVTRAPQLPDDLYTITSTGAIAKSAVTAADTFGALQPTSLGSPTWSSNRASFMLNGQLFSAWSNGQFTRQSFDGSTLGSLVQVNTADLLVNLSDWDTDASRITGMFYDDGRIYFTRSDQNALYYRYLTPESDVVGARRFQVASAFAGTDLRTIKGMFLAGDNVYVAESSGNLARWQWAPGNQSGAPVAGSRVVVSGPSVDGINWATNRPLALYQDVDGLGAVAPPAASINSECADENCAFDGSASTSPGATITAYGWDFGDGSQGTGVTANHSYAQSGDYTVTLTVTTSKGGVATVSKIIQVAKPNYPPTATMTVDCHEVVCQFDGTGSADSDGQVTSFAWDFGDGQTSTDPAPAHTYAADGTYHAILTVTDNQGATASAEQDVEVSAAAVNIVGANSSNGNRTNHSTAVPADAAVGDLLVAFLTVNSSGSAITGPDGWTRADSRVVDGLVLETWTKLAVSADLAQAVKFTTASPLKSDLTVAAYRSTTGDLELSAAVSAEIARSSTQYTAGPATVSSPGSFASYYWGMKSSSDLALAVSGDLQTRIMSTGAGGGRVYAALADRGAVSAAGSSVQALLASDAAATRAASVAVVISPK